MALQRCVWYKNKQKKGSPSQVQPRVVEERNQFSQENEWCLCSSEASQLISWISYLSRRGKKQEYFGFSFSET